VAQTVVAGSLTMNLSTHQAFLDDEELVLTVREFDLLKLFLHSPRQVPDPADDPGQGLGQ